MSKPDDAENRNNPTTMKTMPWGTWEELLLACAVNRHGTKSWDSVAMELQNRAALPLLLTPQNCRQKYLDLQRRFTHVVDGAKKDGGDGEPNKDDKTTIPWLEELRNLRVAELKREVQRYDLSIVSLQLKVKKLEDERERSLNEEEKSDGKPDLEKVEPKDDGDAEKERDGRDERPLPEVAPRKRTSGEESDRENQSFNESNSTDPKTRPRETEGEKRPEVEGGKPDRVSGESPEEKAAASYNGSSDTVAKGAAAAKSPSPAVRVPASEPGESAEFRESVAESKGEGVEGAKESSDVQSSASLSRKKRHRKAVSGCSSGEEPEAEDVSPVSERIPVKSQPLVGVLEIIRSHKHGSVFERRLDSQDTANYRSMIRQHFDLETVRMKLEEGLYSEGSVEFFRDLMLLFNNAVVFFPKNSPEHAAATALRAVVSKEMAKTIPKPHRLPAPLPAKEPTTPPRPLMKPKSEPAISLNGKPGSTGPIIACRKRSSISTKANPAVAAEMKKKETGAEVERKPEAAAAAGKEADDASVSVAAEPRVTKKRTMERTGGGARGTRTSKTRSNNASNVGGGGRGSSGNPNSNPSPSSGGVTAAAKAESSEAKVEKKNATNSGVAKKRSAANFLSRVKRSLSSNGTLLDSLKGSSVGGNGNGRGSTTEQKKGGGGGGKTEGRRDQGQRQGSNGKQQAAAEHSNGKRSVGRPPKRAAATAPSKRGKEMAEVAAEAEAEAKAPARKRARR